MLKKNILKNNTLKINVCYFFSFSNYIRRLTKYNSDNDSRCFQYSQVRDTSGPTWHKTRISKEP